MTATNHGKELVERLARIKLGVRVLAVAVAAKLDDSDALSDLDGPTLAGHVFCETLGPVKQEPDR